MFMVHDSHFMSWCSVFPYWFLFRAFKVFFSLFSFHVWSFGRSSICLPVYFAYSFFPVLTKVMSFPLRTLSHYRTIPLRAEL
ncbi:hypothetical protein L211DRAFT_644331 [Terfezia boudieri ATCC MYA-4762]|uniref:Uncharacterized protein n=1 Tax=Terfezia boudieri ATCC MYA-4762 TaxID=1051890 RepID=A0A3N4LUP2_9PEZI|nr:hypothetical protein L211DRAFT_644331 [Terfezia boudieri ATCC MYA-4762]